jgi:hypothetical protein
VTNNPKLSDLLEDLEVDNLSPEVLEKLNQKLGERSASELANMQKFQLVRLLREEVLPDSSKKERSEIADVLIDSLQDMFRGGTPTTAPAAPSGPIKVTVKQEKTLEQMEPRELLELLVDDSSRYQELLPYLMDSKLVRRAATKTEEWAIPDKDRKINIEATIEYLGYLIKEGAEPARTVHGVRPTTVGKALGIEARTLIHPFKNQAWAPGPDDKLSKIDPELHEAIVFARRTGHENWSDSLDTFNAAEEVIQNPLPGRWQQILEDYRYAKENNPNSVRGISRYWSEDNSSDRVMPTTPKVMELTENDYKELLYKHAQAPRNQMSGSIRLGNILIRSFQTQGGSVHLTNTIVLKVSGTMGGSLSGTVYVPHGVHVYTMGGSNHLNTYERSYKELCRLAGLIS